jgi:hypothetical protein
MGASRLAKVSMGLIAVLLTVAYPILKETGVSMPWLDKAQGLFGDKLGTNATGLGGLPGDINDANGMNASALDDLKAMMADLDNNNNNNNNNFTSLIDQDGTYNDNIFNNSNVSNNNNNVNSLCPPNSTTTTNCGTPVVSLPPN